MRSLTQQFADWARQQPADEKYNFGSNHNCAICQFMKSYGIPFAFVGGTFWEDRDGRNHKLPRAMASAVVGGDWTFGALADRLTQSEKEGVDG